MKYIILIAALSLCACSAVIPYREYNLYLND